MSIVVNIVFELVGDDTEAPDIVFFGIEDAKTGQPVEVGKWIDLPDGLKALQLRVMDLKNRTTDGDGEDICPTCLRVIPPPPPDLSWKRSLP